MRKHIPFLVFYFAFLFTGLLIHDHYGVSWDESECRIDNGIRNIDFIRTGDSEPLLTSISKYHGPAFEMLLVAAEKIFNPDSAHDIFRLRHLVTFLLFALSVIFFYGICFRSFGSTWYALFGVVMFVVSPRIFADSFYNSKDLPFLSMLVISVYFLIRLAESHSFRYAILGGISMGIMVDIRIMGMILPAALFLILGYQSIQNRKNLRKILPSFLVFAAVLIITIIACWPVLWLGPVKHFILAWEESSRYPWKGEVLLNGIKYFSEDIPWFYSLEWIAITVPPMYLVFFVIGLVLTLGKIFKRQQSSLAVYISLWLIVVSILSVIVFHSVLYDGWRHLFFLYPPIVIIAVEGFRSVTELVVRKRLRLIIAAVVTYFCTVILSMAVLHPFENVYFNSFASLGSRALHEKFEVDYWGLSFRQAYEHILKTDTARNIIVYPADGQPGFDNFYFMPDEDKSRITITEEEVLAEYYCTIHRHDRKYHNYSPGYRISRNGLIIHSIYNLRKQNLKLTDKFLYKTYSTDYEGESDAFHPVSVVSDPVNGNRFERITQQNEYAMNLNFIADTTFAHKDFSQFVEFNFKIRSRVNCRPTFVIQIDSTQNYFWKGTGINNPVKDKWNDYRIICRLPEIHAAGDLVKLYLLNYERDQFDIDNIILRLYSVPNDELKSVINQYREFRKS